MSGFLGSHLHQLDAKGRLSLPAAYRREAGDGPMVLLQFHPDTLSLYPEAAWREVESGLRELLRRQPDARTHVLRVTAGAAEVVPDKQGRILIPQRLLEAAGLAGSVLLVGALDRMEIWDPERFDSAVARPSPEFDRFAAQIFG